MKKIIFLFAFLTIISFSLNAQEVKLGNTFDDWSTFYYDDKTDGKICYIAAVPRETSVKIPGRKDSFAMITHRKKAKVFDVFNVDAGYTYDETQKVILEIKGQKFNLNPAKDAAWSDENDDKKIISALIKANDMKITGKSKNSKKEVVDKFSLKGFARAYNEITKECKK